MPLVGKTLILGVMFRSRFIVAVLLPVVVFGCVTKVMTLDAIAERYVKLALRVGLFKPDLVDAYYGPPEWRPAPADSAGVFPYDACRAEAADLLAGLDAIAAGRTDSLQRTRINGLRSQIRSLAATIEILHGKKMSFDEESQALYGVTAPTHDTSYYDSILQALDTMLPGEGALVDRYEQFRKQFIIPPDKIDTLVRITLTEFRRRTTAHIPMPPGDTFVIEYVGRQPWGAYNWYQGNYRGLMQIDTTKPLYVTGMIGLVAHEGYPGHHLGDVVREETLLRNRRWMENSVILLFSPVSLVSEGTGNYAAELAAPRAARIAFIKNVLCPMAGISPAEVERYFDIQELQRQLRYAWRDAARRYLDGVATPEATIAWLGHYCLETAQKAASSVAFFDKFRSYVINYSLGEDLTKAYVEHPDDSGDVTSLRWNRFRQLILDPTALMDSSK